MADEGTIDETYHGLQIITGADGVVTTIMVTDKDDRGYREKMALLDPSSPDFARDRREIVVAMTADGYPARQVSKVTGLAVNSIYSIMKRERDRQTELMEKAAHDDPLYNREEHGIIESVFFVTQAALDRLGTRLADPQHAWKDSDLIKLASQGIDKIATARRWGKDEPQQADDDNLTAIERLLLEHNIQLSAKSQSQKDSEDAIDITPNQDVPEG